MKEIEIRKVNSRKELKKFVDFPFQLYKGNAFWCPPLKFDEINTLREDKNPAFDCCEAQYWIAYQNGKPVGRIAGIINNNEVKCWNAKMVRFGWIDFIDDIEVTRSLIEIVKDWGKSKGMTSIHGPLGFTNMDAEGMLIEGFDEISAMSTIYNFPYYGDHMEKLGFRKATDWVQYEIKIPSEIPDKVDRITRIVLQKHDLHLLQLRKAKEILPYATKMFTLYNNAFRNIYGFTPLIRRQMDYYTKLYLGLIRPEFVSLVIDASDDVVGFGITLPSLSKALQKANGSLFPVGFIHLLNALRKNDVITMCLIGVHPDYQGKGLLALIYHELNKAYLKAGITIAQTHPQLEENLKAISIWKNYNSRLNIRRRCWVQNM
ncbi:MAG: N-acetyltransferase [Bacteroidetes bacterium]|nr:MAG: N-acetyltransferase [Bacteroidota bacterium]